MEQKKTHRTFEFENVVAWQSEFRGTLSASGHLLIEIGNPPAFKGTPDVWCPEDLLIGALNACLMLTFLYQMQLRKLEVVAYESSAQGTLEHRDGKYRVTRIAVRPRISLKSENDIEAARDALKQTVESCMISNSILATVLLEPELNTLSTPA
jgi:organic hydroperoxide reductase OsmC/OhrA